MKINLTNKQIKQLNEKNFIELDEFIILKNHYKIFFKIGFMYSKFLLNKNKAKKLLYIKKLINTLLS